MINEVIVKNTATFDDKGAKISNLKKFNFIFGSNGSGKTTLSRILDNPSNYTNCEVKWADNDNTNILVYNKDFVDKNFTQTIKGVFTLGQKEIKSLDRLEELKETNKKQFDKIKQIRLLLDGNTEKIGLKSELTNHENRYKDIFWTIKQKYSDDFSQTLVGSIGSKEIFKGKLISEDSYNKEELLSREELLGRIKKVYTGNLVSVANIDEMDFESLFNLENSEVLSKKIIGKDDVDIAAMIKKLGNIDWVREGITHYHKNDGICPFCQQNTQDSFKRSLEEFFDDEYERQLETVRKLKIDYTKMRNDIVRVLENIKATHSDFLGNTLFETSLELFKSKSSSNIDLINKKEKESSLSISLESSSESLALIDGCIKNANVEINKHNILVQNIKKEKGSLVSLTWRFLINEAKEDLVKYKETRKRIENDVFEQQSLLDAETKLSTEYQKEYNDLEKQFVSIQPTIDLINLVLSSYGFTSFTLVKGIDGRSYRLIRSDGSDAKSTLSEGEKNFLTFLYFYNLLKGSQDETSIFSNKIVVFDDPVSSLDSDVLFIVSTLIRELISEINDNKGNIKQIIVLTHNVYFYKEVSYNYRNNFMKPSDMSFWVVKKIGKISTIESYDSNPINTSYDLLWNDIRSSNRNNATIPNTLRKILENYFRFVGGIKLHQLINQFEGDDKIKCRVLCSWINDGSHNVFNDEQFTSLADDSIQRYLYIFEQIFEKTGHHNHYNLMMGING